MPRTPFLLAFIGLSSSIAAAQCPQWSDGFAPAGVETGGVHAFATFDDGSGSALYVGGTFTKIAGVSAQRIAKWDGARWSEVGGGLNGSVESLFVWNDGTGAALYVGGDFTFGNGITLSRIAKWDGASFSALGSGVYGNAPTTVDTLMNFDDGAGDKLYVGGSFAAAGALGSPYITRWNGASFETLPLITGRVRSMLVFDRGDGPALYIGGAFDDASLQRVARWTGASWEQVGNGISPVTHLLAFDFGSGPQLVACGGGAHRLDGSTWTGMVVPGCSATTSIAASDVSGTPRLYASGTFSMTSGCTGDRGFAVWNGTQFTQIGGEFFGGALEMYEHDDGSGVGKRLWLGGDFRMAGGYLARGLATFDGTKIRPIGSGSWESVRALASIREGGGSRLYAGVRAAKYAVSTNERWVVERDADGWKRIDNTFFSDEIKTLAVWNDAGTPTLVAGGSFGSFSGSLAQGVAKRTPAGWTWIYPGPAESGSVEALLGHDDGQGHTLFAGGSFSGHSYPPLSEPLHNIAGWEGTRWRPLGGGTDGPVRALCTFNAGAASRLFAGGFFTTAGGGAAASLAYWDGSAWNDLAGGGVNGEIYALAVFDDGNGPALYAGGEFNLAGSTPVNRIARWDGASWSALGAGVNGRVESLRVFDDGQGTALFAAGNFTSAGDAPASFVARWDGASWSDAGNGINGAVHTLVAHDDGGGAALFAAGAFTEVDNKVAGFVSARRGCTDIGTPYCFGDGTGTACPCGNSGAPGNGCATSFAPGGGHLRGYGVPSVTSDSFVLEGTDTSSSVVTYFQGTTRQNGGLGSVFGDGLRCAGGSTLRLGSIAAISGESSYPSGPALTVSVRGAIPAGGGVHRTYQVWFRNAASFCTPSTFNLSNGLEIVWTP